MTTFSRTPYARFVRASSGRYALIATALLFACAMKSASLLHAETTSYSGGTALTPAGSGAYQISASINITAPGTYYLTRDILLTGASAGTPAIEVSYPGGVNVTIDLNGHSVSTYQTGQSADSGNNYYGIGVFSCSNLTVRNGTISGFLFGIFSNDGSTSGHHIENVRLVNNTCCGIYIYGSDTLVRQCQVYQTGGSTLSGIGDCHGIFMVGAASRVVDCDVCQVVHSANNGGAASGVSFYSATEGVALNNRISQTTYGLWFQTSSAVKFRDNLFGSSIATQVAGTGIDAGGNF